MKVLKELRKTNKITQAKLATMLGVSRSTISMWEIDESQPDNDTLVKIADIFNVSTDYLLGQQSTPPSIDDDTLKAAFYGDYSDKLSPSEVDELWEDAKEYALFKAQQRINKKD